MSVAHPLISVVVPAYNVDEYVAGTLYSVLCQSLDSLEVLVVDDASSDKTLEVAAEIARRDGRVRLVGRADNGGVCRARNAALAMARGEWVAFVDSDDWIAPGRLERMVEFASRLGADWLADDQCIVDDASAALTGRVFHGEPESCRRVSVEHLIRRDPPEQIGYGTLKPLVRRRFLADHGIEFRVGHERFEDFIFHIECGLAGGVLALLNEPLYYYRRRSGSLTTMDSLTTLRGMLAQNGLLLSAARLRGRADAASALRRREGQIRSALRYRSMRHALGTGAYGSAVQQFRESPASGLALVAGLGRSAVRRLCA